MRVIIVSVDKTDIIGAFFGSAKKRLKKSFRAFRGKNRIQPLLIRESVCHSVRFLWETASFLFSGPEHKAWD